MLDSKEKEAEKFKDFKDVKFDDEHMLVFKDLKGQVWQISKVEDQSLDFKTLIDDSAADPDYFRPSAQHIDTYKDSIRKAGVEQIKKTANQYVVHCCQKEQFLASHLATDKDNGVSLAYGKAAGMATAAGYDVTKAHLFSDSMNRESTDNRRKDGGESQNSGVAAR